MDYIYNIHIIYVYAYTYNGCNVGPRFETSLFCQAQFHKRFTASQDRFEVRESGFDVGKTMP